MNFILAIQVSKFLEPIRKPERQQDRSWVVPANLYSIASPNWQGGRIESMDKDEWSRFMHENHNCNEVHQRKSCRAAGTVIRLTFIVQIVTELTSLSYSANSITLIRMYNLMLCIFVRGMVHVRRVSIIRSSAKRWQISLQLTFSPSSTFRLLCPKVYAADIMFSVGLKLLICS